MPKWFNWSNVFLLISLIFFAQLFYLVAYQLGGKEWAGGAAITTLIASRWKDVLKVKVFGATAEMRDILVQANATLEQVQNHAVDQATLLMENLHGNGRFGGGAHDANHRQHRLIIKSLEDLNIEESKIQGVRDVAYPYMHYDYYSAVMRALEKGLNEQQSKKWNDFFARNPQGGIGTEPGPEKLEAFLDDIDALEGEVKDRVEDYKHFDKTRQHRRSENPAYWPL